jgi:HSP20 family protein
MPLFNSLFDLSPNGMVFGNSAAPAFVPPADLIVGNDVLTVTMDVPGLNAGSLEIELTGEVLAVRGEREHPRLSRASTRWYQLERGFGKFQRTFQVPKGLDADAVTASIADGILTIHVPLPEARKPRRIQITNGDQQPANANWQELDADVTGSSPAEEPALAGATA